MAVQYKKNFRKTPSTGTVVMQTTICLPDLGCAPGVQYTAAASTVRQAQAATAAR